jgi:hypothetical protein
MTPTTYPIRSSPGRRAPENKTSLAHLIHALNQPLTAVHCALEVGLLGSRTAAEYRRYLRQVLAEVERAFQIASDIREWAGTVSPDGGMQAPGGSVSELGNSAGRKLSAPSANAACKRRVG